MKGIGKSTPGSEVTDKTSSKVNLPFLFLSKWSNMSEKRKEKKI